MSNQQHGATMLTIAWKAVPNAKDHLTPGIRESTLYEVRRELDARKALGLPVPEGRATLKVTHWYYGMGSTRGGCTLLLLDSHDKAVLRIEHKYYDGKLVRSDTTDMQYGLDTLPPKVAIRADRAVRDKLQEIRALNGIAATEPTAKVLPLALWSATTERSDFYHRKKHYHKAIVRVVGDGKVLFEVLVGWQAMLLNLYIIHIEIIDIKEPRT
ncbi:hypothetical protein JT27_18630 [Alcaligenes faecalis]|uniref:hypothetical protein n=1 Tax=Alcaligenes faecalis TaxID=511 RepID=UPI00052BDE58|nr:hypothetical protein [Alcaligenes faecalis]KGP00342.1 hypothetical protein JT27_18630 [Alcaligenes faecalis]